MEKVMNRGRVTPTHGQLLSDPKVNSSAFGSQIKHVPFWLSLFQMIYMWMVCCHNVVRMGIYIAYFIII